MMADVSGGDVKVPGLGEVPRKKLLIIGVIAAVVVAGVLVVRGRGSSAAPATTTTATDPSIDPNTGIPYADEGGSGGIDPATDIPYADEAGGGSYGAYPDNTNLDAEGYPIGSAQDLAYQQQTATGISTNSEWLQAAEGDLPGDQATIQAALSGVLGGITVTTAQKNLFLEAVGINGPPPQGYPTPIKTSDTSAQPGGGTGTTTGAPKVTVPSVAGQTADSAIAELAKAGLRGSITLTAASNHPGIFHIVTKTSPASGASAAKGSTVVIYYRDSKTA